jgi:hypothetical protein
MEHLMASQRSKAKARRSGKTIPKMRKAAAAGVKAQLANLIAGPPSLKGGAKVAAKAKPAHATRAVPRDSRLPAIGTAIKKLDRAGKVRCTCTVTAEGIEYKGKSYGTLSGAAVAAAKDLGLTCLKINGFVFWNLIKPKSAA